MDRIRHLLQLTSRTFALGIRQLPSELERSVSIAYLTLRVSDYLEDNEAMSVEEKIGALNRWADALRGDADDFETPEEIDPDTPDRHAIAEADFVLSAYRALPDDPRDVIRRHVIDSTLGMARWVERGPDFADEADLDDYMFEVAGRVGLLLTDLFSLRSRAIAERHDSMSALAVEFGLGLQTVNVIRGLSSDPERGWVFLPRSFLPSDIDPITLWGNPGGEHAQQLLDRLCTKARRHLDAATDYTIGIPRRERGIRIFCLLPLIFAVETVEMSRGNEAVFSREVKLTRMQVLSIARRTRWFAGSNAWVRRIALR